MRIRSLALAPTRKEALVTENEEEEEEEEAEDEMLF